MLISRKDNNFVIEMTDKEVDNLDRQLSKIGLGVDDISKIDFSIEDFDFDEIEFQPFLSSYLIKNLLIEKINNLKREGVL